MLSKTMRKMGLMERQERERRMMAEDKVRELEAKVFALEAQVANLEEENEAMMARGQKYAEVLNQINKLSWTKAIK
jgi:hypothetical protein